MSSKHVLRSSCLIRSMSTMRSVSKSVIPITARFNGVKPAILPSFARFSSTVAITDFNSVSEMQQKACKVFADRDLFGTRKGNTFEWMTYKEFDVHVQRFRNVLTHHGIKKGDKVALISNNRVEWAVAKFALASLGAPFVPMYEAQLEKDWEYIIQDSDSVMILAGSESVYNRAKGFVSKVGKVRSILCFDLPSDHEHSYSRWMKQAEAETPVPPNLVQSEDTHVLIYTSGTTGKPKGVVLNNSNIKFVINSSYELWQNYIVQQRSLAFLPWAHVYGQVNEMDSFISCGSAMGIVSNREQILESIDLIKPTLILAVPMLFNKVYDGVKKKVGEGSAVQKALFSYAIKNARKRNEALEFGRTPGMLTEFQHKLFDKIIFSKIRERMGGKLNYLAGGGAATSVEVLQFFEDIGIPICEGYGLTETSPTISSSTPGWDKRRLGCVGVPMPGLDVRILDTETLTEKPADTDGEICVSGGSVMVGYHNNPKATEEVFFNKDGKRWFRTGDMGRFVDGKFLKITGRIKEQYKLMNGKYVVPAPLEDMLCRSRYISQAFIFGDNKPFNIALIVPDLVELKAWAAKNNLPTDDVNALLGKKEVKELFDRHIAKHSDQMKSYERPRGWVATTVPFTPDNFMLTPKMSIRRNNVLAAYKPLIEAHYASVHQENKN